MSERPADVCLLLEGTYPYVAGGVSGWTHDLLRSHPDTGFHLLTLLPPGADRRERYEVPENVVGRSVVTVQRLPPGRPLPWRGRRLLEALHGPLTSLLAGGGLTAFRDVDTLIAPLRERLGAVALLDSKPAWQLLLRMYHEGFPASSFLDYFWSWRALLGGLYSVLLGPLPKARVYHTVSTGYAGLYAARAAVETGRPVLLTEHGIYTNERRIEIAMADWLHELPLTGLAVDRAAPDLKDLWTQAFEAYSLACYQACEMIVTLYEGNQQFQLADGAPRERMRVVPNGVDVERFAGVARVPRAERRPAVALIGRVVPIKDVKTYIRACAMLRERVPELVAYVMGPTEEDEEYFEDCQALVQHLALDRCVQFTGRVRLEEWIGRLDAVVLTSISEAQPLVLLEAGACGIPAVATDVGACREILLGRSDEEPPLGPGGAVTLLSDPEGTADALANLLKDEAWHARCGAALAERVQRYYHERDVVRTYGELYARAVAMPDRAPVAGCRGEAVA